MALHTGFLQKHWAKFRNEGRSNFYSGEKAECLKSGEIFVPAWIQQNVFFRGEVFIE